MINHEKEFIALFSPKCACTTLKLWFAESLEQGDIEDIQYLTRFLISMEDVANFHGYQKFLFVRSPHERLVSFYCAFIVNYLELWGFADNNKEVNLKGKTFSEFIHILEDLWQKGVRFQHHLEPQLSGLELSIADLIIRTDNIDCALVNISRDLGFEYIPKKLNATNYSNKICEPVSDRIPEWFLSQGFPFYEYFYNAKLKGIVNRIYAADLLCYEKN
jgi:hypothetical protein